MSIERATISPTGPRSQAGPVPDIPAYEGEPRDYQRRWWTLGVLCLSLVMIVVANASLNVALPTLVSDLHASSSSLQWIVDAYGLVFAGLLLTAGSLGDRFGRRLALNGGLVIFGGASALAAMSGSASALIAARAVMGVGAAFIMPATLSILAHVFPPNERPRAIAIWAAFAGIGVALGGVISGWLLRHFWWGSIFLINVVVVVIALVVGAILIPKSKERMHASLDPVGAILSIAGLGTLVYAIIEAPDHGWGSGTTIGTFALAVGIIIGFVRWELHTAEPMLDLRYFRNPRFSAATTAITFVFFVMFGTYFVITQYLQSVHGYDPFDAGVRILPFAVAYMISATRSARLVERFGQRRVVSFGMVVVAAGLAMMSRSGVDTSYWYFAISLALTAFGMGLVTAPSTGAIMQSLPLGKAGVGSAVNDTTRELGGALGVAVFGSLVASTFHSEFVSHVSGVTGAASRSLGAALQRAATLPTARGGTVAGAAREAFVRGFDSTLTIAVGVSLVAAVLVTWLLRPAARTRRAEETDAVTLEAA